jgi:hypothetical protein
MYTHVPALGISATFSIQKVFLAVCFTHQYRGITACFTHYFITTYCKLPECVSIPTRVSKEVIGKVLIYKQCGGGKHGSSEEATTGLYQSNRTQNPLTSAFWPSDFFLLLLLFSEGFPE